MIDKTQAPILITGCGRSGASMIAGVVNICGAFGGNMGGANRLYENEKVKECLINPYMRNASGDKYGQYPLPDVSKLYIPIDWSNHVLELLRSDGYKTGLWMYKDSRSCLIWPVWAFAFPNAKWLIVRRRTGDIIQSCIKTSYMNAFMDSGVCKAAGVEDETAGWKWWVHQHEKRFVEMITEGLNCRVIWPERMVLGDYQQLYETIEWLGLKWKTEALSFIDPKLWKSRQSIEQTA